jgi:hypothetical protein
LSEEIPDIRFPVTQEHIDQWLRHAEQTDNCIIFHAARDAGYDVGYVNWDYIMVDGQTYMLDTKSSRWQRDIHNQAIEDGARVIIGDTFIDERIEIDVDKLTVKPEPFEVVATASL